MVGVPRGGDGTDDDEAAFPFEGVAAFGADFAVPAAVVDLAQRGEHLGAGVGVHRQDRGDVLDDEQAAVADLAEQPAGGVLGAVRLRGGGQQRGLAGDRAGDDGADTVERLHGLGFRGAGTGDDQQPDRVGAVVELFDRGDGEHGVQRVGVVVLAEPAVEHLARLFERDGLRRCGFRRGRRCRLRRLGG